MKKIFCPKCKRSFEEDGNATCVVLFPDECSCVFCGHTWPIKKG